MKKLALILIPLAFLILASDIVLNQPASAQPDLPFSPAVKAEGFIFVSGHIGVDPKTGEFAGNDIASQTRQTLENIDVLLKKEYRSSLNAAVKTTVFLKSMDDYAKMNEVYASFFPGRKPARSTVEVSRLARGALIEIDAIVEAPGSLPVKQ